MTRLIRIAWLSGILLIAVLNALVMLSRPVLAQQSLFSDIKAYRVGDAITITLAERTAAQRESGWERMTNSRTSGSGSVAGGTLGGSFGLDATFDNQARNQNEAVQRDLLQGTMTALVVGIDSLSGNLILEGERHLNVNGDTHVMKVQGTVRPYDVRGNNSVMSYQLANANIEYRRAGGIKRAFIGPGTLATVAGILLVGAAVLTGTRD